MSLMSDIGAAIKLKFDKNAVAMTKAQFNALADERKANRAGSGFDSFGKGSSATTVNVNEGIWTDDTQANRFYIGKTTSNSGSSITNYAQSVVNGVLQKLQNINNGSLPIADIILPTAPTIYPSTTTLTAEQIASGVIKHADSSNSGLIVNGKFDTGTSGWSILSLGDISYDNINKRLKISSNGNAYGGGTISVSGLIIGKKYIVELEAFNVVNLMKIGASSVSDPVAPIKNGSNIYNFIATQTTHTIGVNANNNTVASCDIDNIAVFPADAISRSDLVFLESWHEDISEKNFVYPLGNVRYLGSNTDGLAGIANGSFTGFETYSLFGNWQASSTIIGKGYVWSSLTEAQKKLFLANKDNNCYLDGDKVIQVRYRVRVVMGWGDNWFNVDTQSVQSLAYSTTLYVQSKGKNSNISSDLSVNTSYFNSGKNDVGESGVWIASKTSHGYEGKCYALPIALVHR